MPKSGRKGTGKQLLNDQRADVTIDEFANSKISTARVRKPTSNFLIREVKKIKTVDDKEWYEKDLEEFDNLVLVENKIPTSSEKKKNTRKKSESTLNCSSGIDYPLDLWYLLAEYISPEDVQTFACLCKSSFFVTQTFKFWISVYKRYYTPKSDLPVHLQPACIERPYRLRACVICALYHIYSPFVKRLSTRPGENTNKILKSCCIAFWYHQQGEKWQFYFKFCTSNLNSQSRNLDKQHYKNGKINGYYDPLALLDDVNANSEEGCCVLRITCPHYFATSPTIMGCRLVDIRITMSRDMHYHRVQLMFSAASYQSFKRIPLHMFGCGQSGRIGEIVEFDPTENIQVLDWWHPQYPNNHIINSI